MAVTAGASRRARRIPDVSDWPVRRKVALVLALPLLLAVVLGGLRVDAALDRSNLAAAAASQVTVLQPALDYLSAAEDAAVVHRDDAAEQGARDAAVLAVRGAAAELRQTAGSADLTANQQALLDRALAGSESLRDGSAYASGPSSLVELGQLEADVTLLAADLAAAGSPAERSIALVGQLVEGRHAVTRLQLQVLGDPRGQQTGVLHGELGVESAVVATLARALPDSDPVQLLRRINASNQGAVDRDVAGLKTADSLRVYDELATDLLDEAETALATEASGSRTEAVLTSALVGLALLAALVLALLVSRALVRPLRRLRDGALEVAHERLPETVGWIRSGHRPRDVEPIDVTTTEELGQVARAVDDLHRTAVRLAQGEAELRARVGDMFVTLSRRSTSLVHQQLHLIEQLERDEEDPQRLESLFRLDHLASRMRRTAESLVVLADAPTPRSEQESLTVTEALHAASAGVRDYQRVTVGPAPAARIKGSAAADVVHLLSELVDNALTHSPPDSDVEVRVSSPSGLVLVEIRDHGVGIEPATLEVLNRELRSGGTLTVEATKRMGLLVVSRLARRHGITVLLSDTAERGVTAQVFLPRPLLTSQVPVATGTGAPESADDDGVPDDAPTVEEKELPEEVRIPVTAPGWRPATWEPPLVPPAEPVVVRDDLSAEALAAVINANIGSAARPGVAPEAPAARTASQPLPQDDDELATSPVPAETAPAVTPEPEVPAAEDPVAAGDASPAAGLLPRRDSAPVPLALAPAPTSGAGHDADHDADHRVDDTARDEAVDLGVRPVVEGVEGVEDVEDEFDSPIFRQLRSSWFETDDEETGDERATWSSEEADEGWKAAQQASGDVPRPEGSTGLPTRRPGDRLVPGGVNGSATELRRDPEAIKARLAAHAHGVARGRAAAAGGSASPATDEDEE